MRHLTADQIVDVAEGIASAAAVSHLASCSQCRRQVDDVKSMMAAAADAPVPEPSPLFWDFLSSRIREAVAVEEAPVRNRFGWWRVPASLAALAIVVLAAAVTLHVKRSSTAAPAATYDPVGDAGLDDPSFDLVADLSKDIDWETPADLGLTTRDGAADRAVAQLTGEERAELRRLIEVEMKRPGN